MPEEEVITDQEDLQKWQREMQDATNALIIRVNNITDDVQGIPRKSSRYKGNWFKMAQEGIGALRSMAESAFVTAQHIGPMSGSTNSIYLQLNDISDQMELTNHNLTRIADAMESPLWDIEVKSRGGN